MGALACVCTTLSHARASGFDVPTVGTSASSPTTADAASVHFGPATMTGLSRVQLQTGAMLLAGDVRYARTRRAAYQYEDGLALASPVSAGAIDVTKTGDAATVSTQPIAPAGYLFVAGPVIPDRFWLGGGLYAPYAAVLDFPADGPQRWQVIDATLLVSQATISAAVKVHPRVSLGASVSYVGTLLEMYRIQDFAALDTLGDALAAPPINQVNSLGSDAPPDVRELETLSRPIWLQRTVGHAVTFQAGLSVRAGRAVDIAAHYQHSTRVRARGRFTLDMNDPFFTDDLEAQGLDFPARVEGDSTVIFTLPKRLTVGVGAPVHPRVRLDVQASWARWSDLDAFDITLESPDFEQPALGLGTQQRASIARDFVDAVDLRVLSTTSITKKGDLIAALGYASPAAPTETVDTITPDGHHLLGSVGYRHRFNTRFTLIADASFNYMLPREVSDSRDDLGNGTYNFFLSAVGLHLQTSFGGDAVAPRAASATGSP